MRHCENCDFSKNIEAIGPLKVSPINGYHGDLAGAVEAQARRQIMQIPQFSLIQRKTKMPHMYDDIEKALRNGEDISLDDSIKVIEDVDGSKRDITPEIPVDTADEKHMVITRPMAIPYSLVPENAFKKGVIISLPKGKALLKCVVSKAETENQHKKESGAGITFKEMPNFETPSTTSKQTIKDDEDQDTHMYTSGPSQNDTLAYSLSRIGAESLTNDETDVLDHETIKPSPAIASALSKSGTPLSGANVIVPTTSGSDQLKETISNALGIGKSKEKADERKKTDSPGRSSFSDQFLKIFDKEMMVSLYKMAVKDLMKEFKHHKASKKTEIFVKSKVKKLFSQRSMLERSYPGISQSLVDSFSEPLIEGLSEMSDLSSSKMGRSVIVPLSKKQMHKYQKPKLHTKSTLNMQIQEEFKSLHPMENPEDQHSGELKKRVKLVDSENTPNPKHLPKGLKDNQQKISPGLVMSFYGDVDPSNLIDDGYGISNCIDVMCEKQKQFINHAGSYFENLDNLALMPYKTFLSNKDGAGDGTQSGKVTESENESRVIKLPYGETINVENNIKKKHRKRHFIIRLKSNKDLERRDKITEANEKETDDKAHKRDETEPTTIVELFGKLPRVPLKITLNPKGPLAKLKKPIEIDLKPPGKGEGYDKAIAKANDPSVQVHMENRIFKEDPLDPKAQEKLQQVYADIRKRSVDDTESDVIARSRQSKLSKVTNKPGGKRTKVIVQIPKELLQLASFSKFKKAPDEITEPNNNVFVSHAIKDKSEETSFDSLGSVRTQHEAPLISSFETSHENYKAEKSKTESPITSIQSPEDTLTTLNNGVTYVVGEENENKHIGAAEANKLNDKSEKVQQFAKSLKELQEQAKQAMTNLYLMQKKDPYADIGGKKRTKTKLVSEPSATTHKSEVHRKMGKMVQGRRRNTESKRPKVRPKDPYADLGNTVVDIDGWKRTIENHDQKLSELISSSDISENQNRSQNADKGVNGLFHSETKIKQDEALKVKQYRKAILDPYADIGKKRGKIGSDRQE